ncbi:hypothetical protein AJ80_01041 [Polytolypa hystricis UAMH7299]|uniref:Uncharacterized protein n=1 Tax=Polytolypa hystricis (strain UAMH7299) TaxID=1447883 RepID=A0A2B7Z1P9_POLH7|nr:hypothetical protein AJ80_01041 [Polytolypa hystricis UAMH7299]
MATTSRQHHTQIWQATELPAMFGKSVPVISQALPIRDNCLPASPGSRAVSEFCDSLRLHVQESTVRLNSRWTAEELDVEIARLIDFRDRWRQATKEKRAREMSVWRNHSRMEWFELRNTNIFPPGRTNRHVHAAIADLRQQEKREKEGGFPIEYIARPKRLTDAPLQVVTGRGNETKPLTDLQARKILQKAVEQTPRSSARTPSNRGNSSTRRRANASPTPTLVKRTKRNVEGTSAAPTVDKESLPTTTPTAKKTCAHECKKQSNLQTFLLQVGSESP